MNTIPPSITLAAETIRDLDLNLPRVVYIQQARKAITIAVNTETAAMREALEGLLEWEAFMGGFENPVWDKARTALGRDNEDKAL